MTSRAVARLKESLVLPTLITGLLLLAMLTSPGFAMSTAPKPEKNIVDTAAAGGFTTLVTAVQAAGLEETLRGEGPFTVFAPTDAAFAKIPPEQLDALLKDKEALTKVLTYHVVPGRVMASDVAKLNSAKTVQGQSVTIDTREGVKVDEAKVVQTDIVASNGVIHVIDSVILPK
ncbi:beta-Ig-H3/fasciclin [Sulfurifustis variabilis]|uniref:Beta-Ig-H3/fasciclin n=2 Tax=Sulfurifustis variabilis TaxID=1675686 RepID=A0A1B4V1L3_9GAMM|nr:fasciclin domain-containing protein [Sulfurifustis variabilis]BAU47378.1 beta-Ig-H3/fasciclin [Sulfurifustis variabilis]